MPGGRLDRRTFLKCGAGAALSAPLVAPGATSLLERTFDAMAAAPACAGLTDIEHVVIVIQENRSFDHYFGRYPGVRGFDDRSVRFGPTDDGTAVFRQSVPGNPPATLLPFHINTDKAAGPTGECTHDIGHQWVEQHESWDGGRLGAYGRTHVTDEGPVFGPLTMGYYDRRDLDFFYALADNFTICDHYFTSVISGTIANRVMGLTGTIDPDGAHGGPIANTPEGANQQDYLTKLYHSLSWRTMPEVLRDAAVSWKCYNPPDLALPLLNDNYLVLFEQYASDPGLAAGAFGSELSPDDFAVDCRTGQLPAVSWVNLPFVWTEHPPTPPLWGEYGVGRVIDAVTSNPDLWAKTVVFFTYDDSGGFFDHVPPPVAPAGTPGEWLTKTPAVAGDGGIKGPIGLGPRVPMIVVSPWSRNTGARGDSTWRPQVCSDVLDHTSQLRFLVTWLGAKGVSGVALPNDTAWRKATVGDLTGAFSFAAAKNVTPPTLPPRSLPAAATYPECLVSPITEVPHADPPTTYAPALSTAAIPAQEPSLPARRPTGLAGCSAATGTGPVGVAGGAGGRAGGRLPATGGPSHAALATAALVAGAIGLRNRGRAPAGD